jgi:hypothetical protein
LTAFGREVVRRYRDAYARIESVARAAFAPLIKQMRPRAGKRRAAPKHRARSIKRGA